VDTLKTAVVVVLLLAVLYGVYVVLNKPEQYPQELAWETGATDPALQIELGSPETDDMGAASVEATGVASAWGSPSPSIDETADSHASHAAEASGATEHEHATHNDLGDQPSLPIPEATTPAAPAIAAPDLIDNALSEFDAQMSGDVPDGPNTPPADYSATIASNELRDPANNASGVDSSTDRFGDSNRYSDYSPLRDEPTTEVGVSSGTQAPADATQANVNDVAETGVPSAGVGVDGFESAMRAVHTKIEGEAWYDALLKLSSFYNDPNLSAGEMSQLVDLLDPLAGKVIYSTEHLIEPAYQSQPGDTIKNISDRYQVPWQLLGNINGIENPETLLAGRELKVVRGPFRAEVSLSKKELTLFVGKLYAGRFAISVGNDPAPLPGQYQINDKQPGRTYYAGNGQTIPIDDPSNPYGRVWLDLGSNLCIHGSSPNGVSPGQGCIALTARDAGDIFGILSKGSSVVISR